MPDRGTEPVGGLAQEEEEEREPTNSLWQDLRALPREFWILFVGVFVNRFGSFVVPFMVFYFSERGFAKAVAGMGIMAYGLGGMTAVAFAGVLADRIGRRNTLCLSMFSSAAAIIVMSRMTSAETLIGIAAVVGFTHSLGHPATGALLADIVPPHLRVRAYATIRVAVNFGFACGGVAGGLLATISWDYLFWGDAATSVVYGIIAIYFLPHGIRAGKKEAGWSEAIPIIRKDKPFLSLIVANFFAAVVMWQASSTYAVKVESAFNTEVYGWLLALNGIMIVFLEIPLTGITTRFSPRRMMAVGYMLCGIGFSLNMISDSLFILALSMAVLTLGEMTYMPVSSAYVASLAPEKMRGRYMGAFGLSWSVSVLLGPLLGMLVYTWAPNAVWIGCGILGGIAAAVILWTGDPDSAEENSDAKAPPSPS